MSLELDQATELYTWKAVDWLTLMNYVFIK